MRRYLIVAGTQNYLAAEELPSVPGDLDEIDKAFGAVGYDRVARLLDPGTDALRRRLGGWAREADRGDDALVVYYTGHGERDGTGHFLLCADSEPGGLADTALATEDIAAILTSQGVRRLLVIIDTCYAEAGTAAAVRKMASLLKAELIPKADGEQRDPVAFAVIAAARRRESADQGVFARAFRAALDDQEWGGQRQPYLHLSNLIDHVNKRFDDDGVLQHATYAELAHEGGFSFLPNPRYVEQLPPEGTDLAEQSTQARRRREELAQHFQPRGRGTDTGMEPGHYFVGREAVLREFVGWLGNSAGGRGIVVTGSPGAGKSAVLGRLVVLSDPATRVAVPPDSVPPGTDPGQDAINVAIHARHKTMAELVMGIAAGAGVVAGTVDELLVALRNRVEPLVIVVDALDEAGTTDDREPETIATQLLRRLVRVPCVRLLVGTRPAVVNACGPDFTKLDLDEPQWITRDDLARYARLLLVAPHGVGSSSAYTPDSALPIAKVIAANAYPNYLVTRLTARALAVRESVTAPEWEDTQLESVPTAGRDAGPAFRWALAKQLGPDEGRARDMLTPLAFAEGAGLPWGAVWPAVIGPAADIAWLLKTCGAFIVEALDEHHRSVYRLYHESFADELRASAPANTQERIVDALLSLVPNGDWAAADPYLHAHLATHAAACGRLDELVNDPGFLLTADRAALIRAMASLTDPEAIAVRLAYERCAHLLDPSRPLGERASSLHLAALATGADPLAALLARVPGLPWLTRWMEAAPGKVRQRSIGLHDRKVMAVATTHLNGVPSIITGDAAGDVRVWALSSGELTHEQTGLIHDEIGGIAALSTRDGELVVILGDNGTLGGWYPAAGTMIGSLIRTNQFPGRNLTVAEFGGDPIAAFSAANRIEAWNLRTGRRLMRRRLTLRDWPLDVLTFVTHLGEPALLAATTRVPWRPRRRAALFNMALFRLDGTRVATWRGENLVALAAADVNGKIGVFIASYGSSRVVMPSKATVEEFWLPDRHDARLGDKGATLIRYGDALVLATLRTGELDLWDASNRRDLRTIQVPAQHGFFAAGKPAGLTAEGANWVVFPAGRSAQVVDVASGTGPMTHLPEKIVCLAMPSGAGCVWAVADQRSWGGAVIGYEIDNGVRIHSFADEQLSIRHAFAGIVNGEPLLVITNFDRLVMVGSFGSEGLRPLWEYIEPSRDYYQYSHFAQDGQVSTVVHVLGRRIIWWKSNGQEGAAKVNVWRSAVLAVNGVTLLFGIGNNKLFAYEVESGRELWSTRLIRFGGVAGMGSGWIDTMPVLLVANNAGIKTLNALTGKPVGPILNGHAMPPKTVEVGLLYGQPVAISGGADRTVRIWNLRTWRQVAVIDIGDLVNVVALGPDNSIFVGTDQGLLRIDISPSMSI